MNLARLRKKIDAIDEKIVQLLNERADLSKEIGEDKLKNKKTIYAPEREHEILSRLKQLNKGPMPEDALETIYREIMSTSLSLEKMRNIAYLGTAGSFTHMAAQKKFGSQVEFMPCGSIPEIFQKVERGECDYGVVPIENSTEGAVTHTFDLLVDSDLKICAQVLQKVSQNLLAKCNLKDIKYIYSHPQAFGQCRLWLMEHLPEAGQIWVPSTTQAAQKVVVEKYAAAVASSLAASVYDLPIIARDIQDISHNTTRFLVLATHDVPQTGKDRTSLLFSIKDRVGALHAMLTPFFKQNINLTKIESRPSKKRAWDYVFFVDCEGHRQDQKVQKALAELEEMCKYLKVLGSYPMLE